MLQQFMVLLNEKKRKIRDQSRLLAGVEVKESTGKTELYTHTSRELTWRGSINGKGIKGGDQASKSCCVPHFETQSHCKGRRTGSRAGAIVRCRPNGS